GGKDDLAAGPAARAYPVADELDTGGAVSFEEDARRQHPGLDAEIGPFCRRMQIGARGTVAKSAAGRRLRIGESFLPCAVHVRIAGIPSLRRGIEHTVEQRIAVTHPG